jgi:hypothetical protein
MNPAGLQSNTGAAATHTLEPVLVIPKVSGAALPGRLFAKGCTLRCHPKHDDSLVIQRQFSKGCTDLVMQLFCVARSNTQKHPKESTQA